MLVRKFYAETSREALHMVRQAMGEEALILSNRRVGRGVEILATSPAEVQSVTMSALHQTDLSQIDARPPMSRGTPSPAASNVRLDPRFGRPAPVPARPVPAPQARTTSAAPARGAPSPQAPAARAPSTTHPAAQASYATRYDEWLFKPAAVDDQDDTASQVQLSAAASRLVNQSTSSASAALARAAEPTPVAAPSSMTYTTTASTPLRYDLVHELRLLRSLMEGQLAALAWNDLKRRDPARSETMRRMIGAGFGAALSRAVVDELPEGLDAVRALRLVKTRLQQRLRVAPAGAGLVDAGGILALVGPTGVGKTTTVAKLAAECALKHGAAKLALVTTDTYRIGAVDQLRIYGKILGVPVYAIRNEADLRSTLEDLRSRHLVLIDTVGMSQRDRRLADQVALLSGSTRRVQRVLLVSAVSHLNVIEDVVRAYRGPDLAGCILTKIDEALNLGTALDSLIRHDLTLHYVTNGQRVPEDLHRPNSLYLVERAFRENSQPMDEGDLPYTLAAGQN